MSQNLQIIAIFWSLSLVIGTYVAIFLTVVGGRLTRLNEQMVTMLSAMNARIERIDENVTDIKSTIGA